MLEKPIRTKVLKWLNSLPEAYFSVSPPSMGNSRVGWPDINGSLKGRYVGIETKRVGKEAERHQKYVHKQLRLAGAIVFVAHSLGEAKTKLQYWLEELKS